MIDSRIQPDARFLSKVIQIGKSTGSNGVIFRVLTLAKTFYNSRNRYLFFLFLLYLLHDSSFLSFYFFPVVLRRPFFVQYTTLCIIIISLCAKTSVILLFRHLIFPHLFTFFFLVPTIHFFLHFFLHLCVVGMRMIISSLTR